MPVPVRDDGTPGPTRQLIVFVHGFRSSARTWDPLRRLLEQDAAVTSVFDLQCFDYETALAAVSISQRLPSLAEAGKSLAARLKTELIAPDGSDRFIDVTLVGHSMGGLIIQSCLLALLTPDGSTRVLDRIRQVILFATPNFGSSTFTAIRRLAALAIRNPQEAALREFSEEGMRLHEEIRDRVIMASRRGSGEYPIPFYCFSGRTDDIVRAESAMGHFPAGEPLPGDHSTVHCPATADEPAYRQFIGALQRPNGHSNIWEIERFTMTVKVSPLPPGSEILAQHGGRQRTVVCDNVATISRKAQFSINNNCRHPYVLKYGTRNGGWIVPRISEPHVTPPDKLRVYDDHGMDAYYEVEPSPGTTARLDMKVYKGFDAGHRDYHMHLGRGSYYRRVVIEIDLSDYRRAGWQIEEPALHFHLTDPGDHTLCAGRALFNPDPPVAVDPAGIWTWELEFVKEGVIDVAWDLRPAASLPSTAAAQTIQLAPGQHAIFGYGSLLSIASLERTLGREYVGPFLVCTLAGWRRRWNVAMPNQTFVYRENERWVTPQRIVYLNVEPANAGSVNGVVFVVNDEELERFDAREWIYNRVDVTDALQGAAIEGGTLWVYGGKPEHVLNRPSSPHAAAIRRTYLDILRDGHQALGADFARTYDATTEAVPTGLVVTDVRRDDV